MTKKDQFNQLMQSKEEVKVILYTNSSSVGLCYTFNEIIDLIKNKNDNEINKLTEEDIKNLNRISTILYDGINKIKPNIKI